jgi:dihydrodipicolinate synthase/N-acetylneuraminate lyase
MRSSKKRLGPPDVTKRIFEGVIPILPTPFTGKGEVDDESFAGVIDAAIAAGAHGLAMFGLASEYYKLSDAERSHLINLLVRHTAKRLPVVVSITPHATTLAVAEALRAVKAGVDALMISPPFFLAPTTEMVARHIREIARAVPIPIIVQYAPLQTGRAIDTRTFTDLQRELPNLASVKVDFVPSGPMISDLHNLGLGTLVGYMGLHLPEDFARGVDGVMPSVSVVPAFAELWSLLHQEHERALSLHQQILPLLNFMMQSVEGLIACEKELLYLRGIIRSNYCRQPAFELDPVQKTELEVQALRLAPWLTRRKGTDV